MNIPFGVEKCKPRSYKDFKVEQFEKNRVRMRKLFSNINSSSLKEEDKTKLINELKEIVKTY